MKHKSTSTIAGLAILLMVFTLSVSSFAQSNVRISGTVVDELDEPLMGVGIFQVGTSNGTTTDLDGNYSISVPDGAELEFSYIGYLSQRIRVSSSRGTVNIKLLPDTEMLNETVVVGYGVQKKSDLTGAISSIKSEDLSNRTVTSAEMAIAGKTAGIQMFSSSAAPGSTPSIRVRGVSSNGSSDPLYVVDGTIVSSISTINPSDIESMEILKDGASAAIYGARAGNGVVLITTRKGSGDGKVNYDFQYSIQSLAKRPQLMNANEYKQYYLEKKQWTEEKFAADWDGKTDTYWPDVVTEKGIMQQHSLSFSQGYDKGNIYLALSYLSNDGMLTGDKDSYNRITGMINGSWNIKKWLQITTNNQISYTTSRSSFNPTEYGTPLGGMLQMDPLTPPVYKTYESMPSQIKNVYDHPEIYGELLSDKNGYWYAPSLFFEGDNTNPLIMIAASNSKTQRFMFSGTTALNLTPVKGLSITSRLGYRITTGETFSVNNDYYLKSTSYTNYASVSANMQGPTYYQWENFANYSAKFGKSDITLMAGTSYSQSRSFSINGSYSGTQNTTFGFEQDDPNFLYWAYATGTATRTLSGAEPIYGRNLSFYGRANWSYGNKYLVQASLRADAADSSILPVDNRWGYFPAVSAGWTLSNEEFFSGVKNIFPYVKIRASWGQNGSTASLGNYQYASVMGRGQLYPSIGADGKTEYITGYLPTSTGNNRLRWETSEQIDLGIDLRFLQDRLSFSADWYQKKTKDLIVTGTRPSASIGLTVSPINAGNVVNKGFEFEAGWQDTVGDFHYSIRANASTLKNEVTYIDPSLQAISGATFHIYGAVTRFEKGYPAWHFYGYEFDKIDPETGNPLFKDLDSSGGLSEGDKTDLGSGIPRMNYGLTFTAGWKNFDFILFASGAAKTKIFALLDRSDYPTNKLTYYTKDRWTPSNTAGSMPRAGANNYAQYLMSSASVLDGSYLKIKQIQLGYTLPSSLLSKIKISSLRVYASLDDFFTFTKYPGLDPEITNVGSSMGVDKGAYPTAKKAVFGVNLSF